MYDYDYNEYSYDYSNGYTTTEWGQSYTTIDNPMLDQIYAIMPIVGVISFIVGLLMIVSIWKIFKKAGKHGWASIVPIYNVIVQIEIAGLPLWYFVLLLIPFVNIYATFKVYIEMAHKFGKSTGFGVASVFFPIICFPILAFGKCTYEEKDGNLNNTISMNNNIGVNTVQFQNMVNNNEVQSNNDSINNVDDGVKFNPEPVIPSFIPSSDTTNNMHSDTNLLNNIKNDNVVVDNSNENILNNNMNSSSIDANNVMWNVNGPVDNISTNNVTPVVEDVSLNVNNSMDNNFSDVKNTMSSATDNNNLIVNSVANGLDNDLNMPINVLNNEGTTTNNVQQPIIPNIQNIDVDKVNDVVDNEVSKINEQGVLSEVNNINVLPEVQKVNEIPSIGEANNNIVSDNSTVDNQINKMPINNMTHNIVPEMQSIPNISRSNNKNMSNTMSLNEILADINIEEQK